MGKNCREAKKSSNCNFANVPKLNEEIDNNKQKDRQKTDRHSEISKSVIVQMSNAALQYQQQPFEPKMFVSLGIYVMTVLGTATQLISAER